jgi:hypothetical protein
MFKPNPSLNFAFLTGAYTFLGVLCLLFASLQFLYGVTQVSGFWIVPAPALLGLPYVAYLWRIQAAEARKTETIADSIKKGQ